VSEDKTIRRVGLVELPDDALDLLSHYTQDPWFEVVLVVGVDPESYPMRMAEILQVPISDVASRMALGGCDLVVVGPKPSDLLNDVQEMMGGMPIEVISVTAACEATGLNVLGVQAPGRTGDDWDEPVDEFEVVPPGGSPRPAAADDSALHIEHELPDAEEAAPVAASPSDPTPAPTHSSSASQPASPPQKPPTVDLRRHEAPENSEPAPAAANDPDPDPMDDEPYFQTPAPDPRVAEDDVSEPVSGGFDVGPVLGEDLRGHVSGLSLDTRENELLDRILDTSIQATHTQSGSIMLLDRDQKHLRIAVARGLPGHVVRTVRQRVGEGVAGEVFANGKPRLLRGRVPRRGPDRDLRPRLRQAAVVPILSEERPIGVLCVNLETDNLVLSDDTILLLARFATEISTAILKAIQVDAYDGPVRHQALLRQVERLMALDDPLPRRLLWVGGAASRAYRAEAHHLFVVDPLGKRLERLTGRSDRRRSQGDFLALDRGALGWAVRRGAPQAVVLTDPATGDSSVSFLVPIRGTSPHGLLVLENTDPATGPEELAALDEILQRVGEIIEVEKNLVAQEVFTQLQLRIQDHAHRFGSLLPHERARAVIEFTVDLLAAECAVWVAPPDERPIWTRPSGNHTAALQARFRRDLDAVARCIAERGGSVVAGLDPAEEPGETPAGFTPWVGVTTSAKGGVFIVVFSPEDAAGTPAQVPAPVLLRVIQELATHLPDDLRLARPAA